MYDIAGLISWLATGERPPLAGVLRDAYVRLDAGTFVRPDLTLTLLADGMFPPRPIDPRYLLLAVEFVTPWFVDGGRRATQRAYIRLAAAEYWTVNIEDLRVERWRRGVDIPEVLSMTPDPDAPAYERFSMFQGIRRELLAPRLAPSRRTGTE